MTCLTSSFNNNLGALLLVLCLGILSGCSGLGNQRPLTVSLQASRPSPQAAYSDKIIWQADVTGGTAPLTYEYWLLADDREMLVQAGPDNFWSWQPRKPGDFQVRVAITDAKGYGASSPWFSFHIDPAIDQDSLVAFFPLDNISGVKAPLDELGSSYAGSLQARGIRLLSNERLADFMFRHRVRYTGGIGSELARALRDEEGVDAVIITSLESYDPSTPPEIALTSRLVLCRDLPQIVWIEGVGITGEDAPGLLGLGRVREIRTLQENAFAQLLASLSNSLAGKPQTGMGTSEKIMPREFYLATGFDTDARYKIAVVPFLNRYARRNAGFVIPLQFVNLLSRDPNLEVIEPGLVREQLLKYRLIMQAGPSLAVADVLASRSSLAADLVLSGYVFDYQDRFGIPKLDFSTRLFSGPERKIVWWSRSNADGDDGVYFYDVGRYHSAHVMLRDMTRAINGLLFPPEKFRSDSTATDLLNITQH